jgi:hypothetical protein
MNKQLSKTDFILYKECPKNVWIKWHKPEEYSKFEISEFEKSLGVMGNEVEELARGMFPDGFLIERRSEGAQDLTKKLIAERTPVIFQAVFSTDKYLAATDVLKWNSEANAYDVYEIKMSSTEDEENDDSKPNKKKELQFEYDLAFQTNVAKICGVMFNKKYLVRLNKNYIRQGALNFSKLFEITDKTEVLNDTFLSVVETEMNGSVVYLSQEEMPKGNCPCYYKGRSAHCTTFSLSNPEVPKYSVHDLHKIGLSKKYLSELLSEGILNIGDVPEDERLKPKKPKKDEEPSKPRKLNQVRVHKTQEPIVDLEGIKVELNSLKFPLYFLDYETYPTAIPPFDGYHPYQHIVFQYSLHVVKDKDSKPEHFECLVLEGDPSETVVKNLREHIGDTGSVISWYKHFENSRNRELAELLPQYSEFLNSIVDRTYDLMDIVHNQHYVHPNFKGSSSIKKVQPVLASNFDYKKLGVQNGTDAIDAYRKISRGELVGQSVEEKRQEMLEYCKYDTEVMYEIWKFFEELVS